MHRSLASRPIAFLFSFLLLLPLGILADDKPAQCYSPNGAATSVTGGSLQIALHACPAGPDGFATCCAEGDTCSPDRLCYNAGGNNVWRNFCTDPTWNSKSCSPLCRGSDEWNSGPVQITPCQDGMMCCGGNNTQCCNNHQGSYAFIGTPINATSSSQQSSGPSLTGGEIAGIVVGIIAILLLTAVLVLLVLRFRSDKRKSRAPPKRMETPDDVRAHLASPTTASSMTMPPLKSQASVRSHQDYSRQRDPYPTREQYQQRDQRHEAPYPDSLRSHPSTRSHDHHYASERERPLPALPRMPSDVHELGGGEGISRFEVSGQSVWDQKKY